MAIRACFGNMCSQVQILPPRPIQLYRRSPTARGTCLRNKVMWVQISPSVPVFYVEVAEVKQTLGGLMLNRRENVTRAGESPAFDKPNFRVGDVIDSIEVLQTSCKGLNPFRSTRFIRASSPTAEAIGLKPIYVKVQIFSRALWGRIQRVAWLVFQSREAGSSPAVLTRTISNREHSQAV